jgi:hypothetical protein
VEVDQAVPFDLGEPDLAHVDFAGVDLTGVDFRVPPPDMVPPCNGVTVSTFTGTPNSAGTTEGAPGTAKFSTMRGLTVTGNVMYVGDSSNNRVRAVDVNGNVSLLAGSTAGFMNGVGAAAQFSDPRSLTGGGGFLYVADDDNHRIRKITIAGANVGVLSGNGNSGSVVGAPGVAQYSVPRGVALDAVNNIIYVADTANDQIRKLDLAGNSVAFAGGTQGFLDATGTNARFDDPHDMECDAAGNLYVGDRYNHRIRKVTPAGVVTTVAGDGSTAVLNEPYDVAIAPDGYIYITENQGNRIRRLSPGGQLVTFAGTGTHGYQNGSGCNAQFGNLYAIQYWNGALYVADGDNNVIRKLQW